MLDNFFEVVSKSCLVEKESPIQCKQFDDLYSCSKKLGDHDLYITGRLEARPVPVEGAGSLADVDDGVRGPRRGELVAVEPNRGSRLLPTAAEYVEEGFPGMGKEESV